MDDEGRIRLVNGDDGQRRRVTVLLRLFMALPQFIWWLFWSTGAFLALPVHWIAALVAGRPIAALHSFYAAYVRFTTHLFAYYYIGAERWPPFLGDERYAIDVEIPGRSTQRRWTVGLRLILALPPLVLTAALTGFSGSGNTGTQGTTAGGDAGEAANVASTFGFGFGLLALVGVLAWFSSLALGRTPRGIRDTVAYCVGYAAQTWGYLFLLTERYPTSDPSGVPREPMPEHPVRLECDDDRSRSRLLVLFRLPLAFPHLLWATLWGIVALLAAIVGWLATLALGRLPGPLHRFLARYVRYATHVYAFLYVLGGPFPGFTGRPGSYPVDLGVDDPARQSRWKTLFRALLAFPAFLVASGLGSVQFIAGIGAWWAALVTGSVPEGLHRLLAWTVRYQAQLYAYLFLLCERYPYTGPDGPGVREATWHDAPERPPGLTAVPEPV